MSAFVIDAFEFSRLKEQAEGELAVADMARLAGETADRAGVLKWSLSGGADKVGHPQLKLSVSGQVNLVCQRCLTAMPFTVSSESVLVLAKDEESADAIEELLNDESIDVIVGEAEFNVGYLVEDEALLALPVAPKHESCPAQALPGSGAEAAATEKVSPFSVLKNLKQ
ncbi:YceD family protein [Herbaspirillum lusitanum]|uniref:YceD family protein n=1 Tax=Herbaspirillum lusitanum TaxID=213312 RepID=UPI0002D2CDD7|nr:YceD family protein [Herbaspirillum lusitanum]